MGYHDHAITVFLPAFGQLLDHDLTRGADSKGYPHFLHLLFHLFLAHLLPTFFPSNPIIFMFVVWGYIQ